MLLTLTADRTAELDDASDLGYLLHKHPERVQEFAVFAGTATVLYPEVSPERTTVALVLEVDPIALVRSRAKGRSGFSLAQYVNDRPYAATSLLAVALGKVFRTALAGRCDARPELVDAPLALTVELPAVPGGPELLERLFGPLGWSVDVAVGELDPAIPAWGDSPYARVLLTGTHTLHDALNHLYVLIPVLDGGKHYWVSPDEVDKLVRAGAGWLATHPERELISRRYLAHSRAMVDEAMTRLAELDDRPAQGDELGETAAEAPTPPLVALRHEAVLAQVERARPSTVLDLGCGQGALLRRLLELHSLDRVVGTEVSDGALSVAARRLRVDRMSERQAARLDLWLSSLQYQDDRLSGFDVAVLMEVIEHIDPERLPAVAANVFGFIRPGTVIVTTPNAEYNPLFPGLTPGALRHPDHRFEWTRAQFAQWCREVGERYRYDVETHPVGPVDPDRGAPTQLAVLTRRDATEGASA